MGLGEIIDVAKQFASNGTVEKILIFADGLDQLNGTLARMAAQIDRLERGKAEPGSGPPVGGTGRIGDDCAVSGISATDGPERKPAISGASNVGAHD